MQRRRGAAAVGGELHALINIRPSQGNRSMSIEDSGVRERVREFTFSLIGRGEPLG